MSYRLTRRVVRLRHIMSTFSVLSAPHHHSEPSDQDDESVDDDDDDHDVKITDDTVPDGLLPGTRPRQDDVNLFAVTVSTTGIATPTAKTLLPLQHKAAVVFTIRRSAFAHSQVATKLEPVLTAE